MRYLYFTKSLEKLDVPGVIGFIKDAGLDGADMAVRPGFPVTPANCRTELPAAAKAFRDAGLAIGIASTATNLTSAESAEARAIFEASAKAGVPFVKVGYFKYQAPFDTALAKARQGMTAWAKLAQATGVRACYHTHSGNYLGSNGASMRLLLQDQDPHFISAYVDTGHVTINGNPIRQELETLKQWLALVAIKDMLWEKKGDVWERKIVPAGEGIVRWSEVRSGLKDCGFDGTISLHGEYESKDMAERQRLARAELAFLRKTLEGKAS
jgi:sugar phosphate isomerase/epimerase